MIPTRTTICGTAAITYDLAFTKRKTLGIIVTSDSQVNVRAPIGTSLEEIDRIVQKRAAWITRKQREFESYPPKLPPRQYLSGEKHYYLGKQYPLNVIVGTPSSVELTRGRLLITIRDDDPARVKHQLTEWYREQARRVFTERLEACYPKIQPYSVPYPDIKIRLMRKRWGSCTAAGRINLNLRLIQAPIPYIDYVIVHELCHLKEHNHSRAYYTLLDCLLPNWRELREGLNQAEIA